MDICICGYGGPERKHIMQSKKWLSLFTALLLVIQSAVVLTGAEEPAVSPADVSAEPGAAVVYEAEETAAAEPGTSSTASAMAAAAASGLYITDSYVNPLYEGLTIGELPADTAESGFRLMTEEADVVFHDTAEEAAEVLLDGMKARETVIVLGVTAELYDRLAAITSAHKEIFYAAYAHDPADPTGGDYIRFTFGGWNGAGVKSDEGWTLTYYFDYYTTLAEEEAVDAKVEELTAAWKAMDMTEYQIVRTIYEYITENVTYDDAGLTAYRNAVSSDTLNMNHCKIFTAYKALIQGTAVCQGFANLFYRLALEMGVDARIIASVKAENHAWNIVKLGRWYYNVDATWDAENVETGYLWFLLNEEEFSVKHTRRAEFDTEAFHDAHPMGESMYVGIDETMTGACGENLTWKLVPEGVLTISGTGAMCNYSRSGAAEECAPWMPWKMAITELVLEEGTASIGTAAFYDMSELTEAAIPGTVQHIGALAFGDCDGITALTLAEGVGTVASLAFAYCDGLTAAALPASASVEDASFYGCTALAEIQLAEGNTALALDDAGVLLDAQYTHIYLAPAASDLTDYTVPETVTGIGAGAFAHCTNLKTMTFCGALPEIHASAFPGTWWNLVLYYPAGAAGWDTPSMTFAETDPDGNAISVTVTTQSYAIKGDFTGDTEVTTDDADLLAEYFAGYPVQIDKAAADINGDGKLTRADAMILKRYLAGWAGYDRYFG